MAPQPDAAGRYTDAAGRYTDKDMTIIIDAKSNHDWIVPRRVMCAFFWIGIILLFTGIILLVTSKHKGEVYRSWGAILLGLGFCLLLICLILCLHAYCVITITEEEPFAKRTVPPPPPSVVMNGRKPRNKGEGRAADGGNEDPLLRPETPDQKVAKPVQLLIVDKEDVENLENGRPLYFRENRNDRNSPKSKPEGKQTATVQHTILGDVHVSVRPANPALGVPSKHQYDVESTEDQIKSAKGPVPPDIPLHLLENLDERSSTEGGTAKSSPNHPAAGEHVIIPSKYATAFSPVKSGSSSRSNPDGANTYIGYQEGLEISAFPLGPVVTAKPPPIPGRHNSQITAHVIPIPHSHYKNYPIGILPPPPPRGLSSRTITQSMALREEAVKMQMIPNGHPITINMPENYIQRIPPEHDHEGRRFSQPVVVYLNPNQNMGLSQLSVYDNVQYVWAEPPPQAPK